MAYIWFARRGSSRTTRTQSCAATPSEYYADKEIPSSSGRAVPCGVVSPRGPDLGTNLRERCSLMGSTPLPPTYSPITMRHTHLCRAHLRKPAGDRASLWRLRQSGFGTGSSENQRVEQGPVRITEPAEISAGMVGGAGRVRTAASQFCSLPEGSTTEADQQR